MCCRTLFAVSNCRGLTGLGDVQRRLRDQSIVREEWKQMTNQTKLKLDESGPSEQQRKMAPTASKETAHEAYMRVFSGNPKFKMSKKSGRGYVIGGVTQRA
jgi:hypothetical protein